jgi:hypothetical protein
MHIELSHNHLPTLVHTITESNTDKAILVALVDKIPTGNINLNTV